MLVSFEVDDKIIANADLAFIPREDESVTIFGKNYAVILFRHEVEIKMKPSGKKAVIEKAICTLQECDENGNYLFKPDEIIAKYGEKK